MEQYPLVEIMKAASQYGQMRESILISSAHMGHFLVALFTLRLFDDQFG